MKSSMRTVIPRFNTNRMLEEYCERFYEPASARWFALSGDSMREVRDVAGWKQHLADHWQQVALVAVECDTSHEYAVDDELAITVRAATGEIRPEDLTVEAVSGALSGSGEIIDGTPTTLPLVDADGDGTATYRGTIRCRLSGRNGFAVRIIPVVRKTASNRFETRLVTWWGDAVARVGDPAPAG